MDNTDS